MCQSATSRWLFLALAFLLSSGIRGEGGAIESLARILSEFVHTCAPAQCETLRSIVAEDTASAPERALAAALLRVNHVPDPDDIAQLQSLATDPAQTPSVRAVASVLHRLVHVPSDEDRAVLSPVASRHAHHDWLRSRWPDHSSPN
jgi:hypothetical protein